MRRLGDQNLQITLWISDYLQVLCSFLCLLLKNGYYLWLSQTFDSPVCVFGPPDGSLLEAFKDVCVHVLCLFYVRSREEISCCVRQFFSFQIMEKLTPVCAKA